MKILMLVVLAFPMLAMADFDPGSDPNLQVRICQYNDFCNPTINWPGPGPGPRPPFPPGPPRPRPPRPVWYYCYAADDYRGVEYGPGDQSQNLRRAQRSAIRMCEQATRVRCHITDCYEQY